MPIRLLRTAGTPGRWVRLKSPPSLSDTTKSSSPPPFCCMHICVSRLPRDCDNVVSLLSLATLESHTRARERVPNNWCQTCARTHHKTHFAHVQPTTQSAAHVRAFISALRCISFGRAMARDGLVLVAAVGVGGKNEIISARARSRANSNTKQPRVVCRRSSSSGSQLRRQISVPKFARTPRLPPPLHLQIQQRVTARSSLLLLLLALLLLREHLFVGVLCASVCRKLKSLSREPCII